jgi:hypothetical protein
MTRRQWLKCLKVARDPGFTATPYLELTVFSGCALDDKRRAATTHEVASLICGHCETFAGTWLHSEEAEVEALAKRFDLID